MTRVLLVNIIPASVLKTKMIVAKKKTRPKPRQPTRQSSTLSTLDPCGSTNFQSFRSWSTHHPSGHLRYLAHIQCTQLHRYLCLQTTMTIKNRDRNQPNHRRESPFTDGCIPPYCPHPSTTGDCLTSSSGEAICWQIQRAIRRGSTRRPRTLA